MFFFQYFFYFCRIIPSSFILTFILILLLSEEQVGEACRTYTQALQFETYGMGGGVGQKCTSTLQSEVFWNVTLQFFFIFLVSSSHYFQELPT